MICNGQHSPDEICLIQQQLVFAFACSNFPHRLACSQLTGQEFQQKSNCHGLPLFLSAAWDTLNTATDVLDTGFI